MRRPSIELNINHERWLVSYADFVTLLFAFFVVMYSISHVNESKYRVLSATLTDIFNEPKRTLEPIQVGDLSRSNSNEVIATDQKKSDIEARGPFEKSADLPQLSDQFSEQFADLIDDKVVQVNSNEYWLQISLNNSILFPLGSVQPRRGAIMVLADIAELLRDFNNPIHVEGYTDNLPVASREFPSNCELSTARAYTVVRLLIDQGIKPTRLAAVGYGEYQPIAENETPEGRAQNRRVVLMIAREKTQRPRVNTRQGIEQAVSPQDSKQTQVNPQPGFKSTQSTNSAVSNELTPKEKMDLIVEDNPGLGIETVLDLKKDQEPALTVEDKSQEPNNRVSGKVKAVETSDGGLLFSSDPDLPRN